MTDYERIKREFDLSMIERLVQTVRQLPSIEDIWPVGSIYMSLDATDPAVRFGGVWERIRDTFLLAAGDAHPAGQSGGEEWVTLTADQMPKHTHVHNDYVPGYISAGARADTGTYASPTQELSGGDRPAQHGGTCSAGGDQPHNNMPPYLSVFVWKRVK